MSSDLILTSLILLIAAALLLSERLRADLVALLVVVALGVTGILTPQEAFAGFSSSAVVTMATIFVLVHGLHVTGVTQQAGLLLQRVGGNNERQLLATIMGLAALLSLIMNNIAVAAILLPAVSGLSSRTRLPLSRLLMPLAFGTILGGMATLFTTTNIIVSGVLRNQGLAGFGVLDFFSVGAPVALAGIAFIVLIGVRWLPNRSGMSEPSAASVEAIDLVGVYRLNERLFRAQVPAGSVLIGRPLIDSPLRDNFGVTVIGLMRDDRLIPITSPQTMVAQGDILVLEGNLEEFQQSDVEPRLAILPTDTWTEKDLETEDVVVVEAVLAPRSQLLGHTLRAARFREKYGMTVLGIWREGRPYRVHLGDMPLQFGDALLLQGPRARLAVLSNEQDFILLDDATDAAPVAKPGKGKLAVGIMAVTLLLATLQPNLIGEIMLAGSALMVLLGLFPMDQVYKIIEWRSIFLVAGLLPLGLALTRSGAAALLAENLVAWLLPFGPLALLAGLILLAILLTQIINGAAVASIVAPVAIQAAQQAGLDPRALALGVAIACSMAFVTPLGHAVNILVMGPAGYRFNDFARLGLPLTAVAFVVLMLVLPLLWPLAG